MPKTCFVFSPRARARAKPVFVFFFSALCNASAKVSNISRPALFPRLAALVLPCSFAHSLTPHRTKMARWLLAAAWLFRVSVLGACMHATPTNQTLHSQGEFDVGAAQPGDQVAFQEDADSEWVLGRVLSWMHETGQYEVRPTRRSSFCPSFPLPFFSVPLTYSCPFRAAFFLRPTIIYSRPFRAAMFLRPTVTYPCPFRAAILPLRPTNVLFYLPASSSSSEVICFSLWCLSFVYGKWCRMYVCTYHRFVCPYGL